MRWVVPLVIACVGLVVSFGYGQTYRWVDEKGTVHFSDDLSTIPDKYREEIETRKPVQETSSPEKEIKAKSSPAPEVLKDSEPEEAEVELLKKGEVWVTDVLLNGKIYRRLVVDSGSSFVLISPQTAKELGIVVDENTPVIPMTTVSGYILTPLVTLKSVQVGKAEAEDIEAVIYGLPSGGGGLLGNSFLNKYRVTLDSVRGKMVLASMKGIPSADRPGGYGRDFWTGRFRFYNRVLDDLKRVKQRYEKSGPSSESVRLNNAIRYFENQLSELDRRASFAGVPRNWRD